MSDTTVTPASKSAKGTTSESKASQANRTEPFDFMALTIEKTDIRPSRKTSGDAEQTAKQVQMFADAVTQSWQERDSAGMGTGRALVVPNAYAKRTETLIRKGAEKASQDLGESIGTNVRSTVLREDGKETGKTRVEFAAKPKKVYNTSN
jgi:hypothetical protein